MSISDLYGSGRHVRNFTHFSSLVYLAAIDGEIKPEVEAVLKRLAIKLGIDDEEYKKAVETPNAFPINSSHKYDRRLERLYDILTVIFADNAMSDKEAVLLKKYAVALGFNSEESDKVIEKSTRILSGKLSFEEYLSLLEQQ